MDQLLNVKRVLRCFQVISGLKVNFFKSSLFGFNVDKDTLADWADKIYCKVETLPTTYLGLPLGNRSNSIKTWKPVVEKFEQRLTGWKASLLSMGGRVTLLKSVLTSLPIFYMSLFQIPKTVKLVLDRILRRFLWGGSSNKRKVHWVDWNSVCNLKENGGLGIVDLKLRNRALLNKWIWRYGEESDAMWKSIIVSKYGGESDGLTPCIGNQRRFSKLWTNITKPFCQQRNQIGAPSDCRYCLGDGRNIRFWWDEWIEGVVLRLAFPRIFALAANKEGKVRDLGRWINNYWSWKIVLRRRLFDWELYQRHEICEMLKMYVVSDNFKDSYIWKGSSSGRYAASLYCKYMLNAQVSDKELWKMVWMGLAPPKVEVFCWRLVRERIATKDQLVKRGLLERRQAVCVFCNTEMESVDHLFFSCHSSWKIWMHFCSMWGVDWVMHNQPSRAIASWYYALPVKAGKEVWFMSFFVISWSIWLMRNDMIFNGKVFDSRQIIDTIRLRIAWWFKAKWPDSVYSILDIVRFPNITQSPLKSRAVKNAALWKAPPLGSLKFNVDGSARGKPGPAGIGGVLRDCMAATKVVFSKAIGVADSNVAELLAIREALRIFAASKWVSSHRIIIESDSSNAVKWVLHPQGAPWTMKNQISHIETLKGLVIGWDIVHTPRECNEIADALAKSGVTRTSDLLVSYV